MTLMNELRIAIQEGRVNPIFNSDDLKIANISDLNNNLSNYDKKNNGSKNTKVLVSTIINQKTYYSFDEQLF